MGYVQLAISQASTHCSSRSHARSGSRSRSLAAVLGHADPKTTALFAHVDTASLARDLRPHLTFAAPSGTVTSLDPTAGAHVVHTIDTDAADPGHK